MTCPRFRTAITKTNAASASRDGNCPQTQGSNPPTMLATRGIARRKTCSRFPSVTARFETSRIRSKSRYVRGGIRTGARRARSAVRDWQASNPPCIFTALTSVRAEKCEGRDSNPRTPTGADLKSAAFVQTRPPSRGRQSDVATDGCFGRYRYGRDYQSTESVPSPFGSGAISSFVRRSTTWITPRSFLAGHFAAASTLCSRSDSSKK